MENKLIFGENLEEMKKLLIDFKGKIDLVYIDPPFATNNEFNISKTRASTISKSKDSNLAYNDKFSRKEYLKFLRERLEIIKELMSGNSSIYLHIDSKIGHYVKILMDEVFGEGNFLCDITRIKCNPKNFSRKNYGNIKDMVLFYSKTKDCIFNDIRGEIENTSRFNKTDEDGRKYTTIPLHAPGESNGETGGEFKGMKPPIGRHWRTSPKELEILDEKGLIEWSKTGVPRKKLFLDENKGSKIQDVLNFKDPQYTKYPTEKNYELIELFIQNSSNENSIVLDCFCGSGTSLLAAKNNNRKYIGIDSSKEAIKVAEEKLSL